MARGALQLSVRDLAEAAGVTANTITRFENNQTKGYASTLMKLTKALQERGVVFIPAKDGMEPGIAIASQTEEKKEGGIHHLIDSLDKRRK